MVAPATSKGIRGIDLLRGAVTIIMAPEHVRDYFHGAAYIFDPTDLIRTDAAMFFTRRIMHFCAPVFTFPAGTSAYLQGYGYSLWVVYALWLSGG